MEQHDFTQAEVAGPVRLRELDETELDTVTGGSPNKVVVWVAAKVVVFAIDQLRKIDWAGQTIPRSEKEIFGKI